MSKPEMTEEMKKLAQDAGFIVNAIGQITPPAPDEDCSKYLAKLIQLSSQRERTGEAVAKPDYQIKLPGDSESVWRDATEGAYWVTSEKNRRIIYLTPPSPLSSRELLEKAAQEAEHWQKIGRPEHKCGEYIAAAIRSLIPQEPSKEEGKV
jgi:hypothetical protein